MENNSTGNQVLEDTDNQIRETCKVLQRQATSIRHEQNSKAIDAMSKKVEHFHLSLIVNLWRPPFYDKSSNADYKDPDSMLASMFSGKLEVTPLEDGAFFTACVVSCTV